MLWLSFLLVVHIQHTIVYNCSGKGGFKNMFWLKLSVFIKSAIRIIGRLFLTFFIASFFDEISFWLSLAVFILLNFDLFFKKRRRKKKKVNIDDLINLDELYEFHLPDENNKNE